MASSRQITFNVDQKVYDGLTSLAKERGIAAGAYARLLFEAAYAARANETGDLDLDAAVARVSILMNDVDFAMIGSMVGLQESTVVRIIEAWRTEVLGKTQIERPDGAQQAERPSF